MPLHPPELDDRTWDQLVRDAIGRIKQVSPEWTDLSPGDPGMTLVEVFAYLTEALIYRLNRVPDKLFIEFLRLIGVRLQPPAAASTTLVLKRLRGTKGAIEIPRGTRVTVEKPTPGAEAPVFSTADAGRIAASADEVRIKAYHAELIEAEDPGRAPGAAGHSFTVRRPPIIAPTGDPLDLVVGVEARPGELEEGDPAIEHGGKTYRVWREVDNFTYQGPDHYVYVADRAGGTILFSPEARLRDAEGRLSPAKRGLAAIPAVDREIRVWYRRGGGADGNVVAGALTTLKDQLPGVEVTNPEPATGGRAAETLENALVRGPQELHTLSRAVTARDFQLVAEQSSGAVARAIALTQADLWRYATPGTVEVHLVPSLPEGVDPAGVSAEQLVTLQTDDALERVRTVLDERRPLGTRSLVEWARYKTVRVRAEIVLHREEDAAEVQRRVDRRLHQTVNPLPTELNAGGWTFGGSLYASSVYKIILSEPGVRYARDVRLLVDPVPQRDVRAMAADPFQDRTWYAGAGDTLFRSLNDGRGWEAMTRADGETIVRARPHPGRPGMVAIATRLAERGSRIHFSRDSGATWVPGRPAGMQVEDIAWIDRADGPAILMATDVGLFEVAADPRADLRPVLVEPSDQDLGFYAVVVSREARGEVSVAVAAREARGVYVSSDAAATFRHVGLKGKDIRTLEIRYEGPNRFLWAGVATPGGDQPGEGCHSWQLLFGGEDPVEGWRAWGTGWHGGSCWAVAFVGDLVLAASHQAGVLRLNTRSTSPTWQASTVDSGLPLRDPGRFFPVDAVVSDPAGVVMAGGAWGIRRSVDTGDHYDDPSQPVFEHEVTIPPTWVLVNGENEIQVTSDA